MKVDGGCHCGAITYEAEVDPEKVTICHCTDCQKLSGTVFRVNVRVPEEHFRLTKGTPKIYVKLSEVGTRRAQAFCAECGTQIYATSAGDDGPKVYGLPTSATSSCQKNSSGTARPCTGCRNSRRWKSSKSSRRPAVSNGPGGFSKAKYSSRRLRRHAT
jgi:hypothetical protein